MANPTLVTQIRVQSDQMGRCPNCGANFLTVTVDVLGGALDFSTPGQAVLTLTPSDAKVACPTCGWSETLGLSASP